jgi:hypothetical protein
MFWSLQAGFEICPGDHQTPIWLFKSVPIFDLHENMAMHQSKLTT